MSILRRSSDGTFYRRVNGTRYHLSCGQRRCPDPKCHRHVFVVHVGGDVRVAYPPEVIDFDATDIPQDIVATFTEALTCHAHGCNVAAAIMVRKTLEQLCDDRQAQGANLHQRLADFRTKVVLPKELLDALDDLKLLGNDAAHLELKTFDEVGPSEVEAAIELTKEILKAVYQYKALIAKLQALNK